MGWVLVIVLAAGWRVEAAQPSHDACLRTMAQATLEPGVKVAYCAWGKR